MVDSIQRVGSDVRVSDIPPTGETQHEKTATFVPKQSSASGDGFVDSADIKTKTREDMIRECIEAGYTQEQAELMVDGILRNQKQKAEFENTRFFVDKAEYKAAKKEQKEKREELIAQYLIEHPDASKREARAWADEQLPQLKYNGALKRFFNGAAASAYFWFHPLKTPGIASDGEATAVATALSGPGDYSLSIKEAKEARIASHE